MTRGTWRVRWWGLLAQGNHGMVTGAMRHQRNLMARVSIAMLLIRTISLWSFVNMSCNGFGALLTSMQKPWSKRDSGMTPNVLNTNRANKYIWTKWGMVCPKITPTLTQHTIQAIAVPRMGREINHDGSLGGQLMGVGVRMVSAYNTPVRSPSRSCLQRCYHTR